MGIELVRERGDIIAVIYIPCGDCVHLQTNRTCKAFPNGIPEKILIGEHDHTKPFKGDNGIRFEPIKEIAGDERL